MNKIKLGNFIILVALFIGITGRIVFSTFGYNYDVESYKIVGEIVDNGGNVYVETYRYNYGPVWSLVLGALHQEGMDIHDFHLRIVLFLTFVDICIAFLLFRHFGKLAAIIFFSNPISIFITGFHSQFDNFAILVALLAVIIYGSATKKRKIGALLLLGLSLSIKHIYFLFPLWLFFKEKRLFWKILVIAIPFTFFLSSFLPYWASGSEEILNNVFRYQSQGNAPFFNFVLPRFISLFLNSFIFFLMALTVSAIIFRKSNIKHSFLLYTLLVVIFSSAIANQYLAIPIIFLSVFPSSIFYLYTILGFVQILSNEAGLKMSTELLRISSYNILILLLFVGMLLILFKVKIFSKASSNFFQQQLQNIKKILKDIF